MSGIDPALIWEWALRLSPVAIGAGGGYLFYRFVGCRSGSCPITGNPWLSTIYGAILGAMYMVR
jgi:hypothetical protein